MSLTFTKNSLRGRFYSAPNNFEQMFKIFGEKFEGFKKFLEGGVCGVGFILATDLYLKDKENFLNPEKFTLNI